MDRGSLQTIMRTQTDNAQWGIQQHATKIRRLRLPTAFLHRGGVAVVVCRLWKRQHIHGDPGHPHEFALHFGVLRACIITQYKQHCRRTPRLEANDRPLGRDATFPRSRL